MLQSRLEREKFEEGHLAPYAMFSSASRGRRYNEDRSARRLEYQRDRDRIVNSKAFRRLEYKTQVFVNGTADHYRTRLTHTIEMASVGRTLARTLKANEDLTAAIALAHDIGHSPFGHSGERKLNELMAAHGGFDHNIQSLRWIDELEIAYPNFDGLNLSWEARAGLMKHESKNPDAGLEGFPVGPFQFMEGQIADVADDITYQANDLEDGFEAGLITMEKLDQLELWQLAKERILRKHPNCEGERLKVSVIRSLFSIQIENVVNYTQEKIGEYGPKDFIDVMNAPGRMVDFSPEMQEMLKPYRDYLFKDMYRHESVERANDEAVEMMERLFMYYIENPNKMGQTFQPRIEKDGLWRAACDYISGFTDRYAIEKFKEYKL